MRINIATCNAQLLLNTRMRVLYKTACLFAQEAAYIELDLIQIFITSYVTWLAKFSQEEGSVIIGARETESCLDIGLRTLRSGISFLKKTWFLCRRNRIMQSFCFELAFISWEKGIIAAETISLVSK